MFKKLKNALGINNQTIQIMSPIQGTVIPVTQAKDPAFSEEILGKGVAIQPKNGQVFSPVDGTVFQLFDTLHAISLVSNDGVEILIHIGMDTVQLKGKHFTANVKTGDAVSVGDLLLTFDKEAMLAEGFDLTTPVVVCNHHEYKKIEANYQTLNPGDSLITLEK